MWTAEEIMADFERKLKSGELKVEREPNDGFKEWLKENNMKETTFQKAFPDIFGKQFDFLGEPIDD